MDTQNPKTGTPRKNSVTYKDIFHSIKNAVFLMDRKWNILQINKYAEVVTGYSVDALKKMKTILEIVHPEDVNVIRTYHERRSKGDSDVPEDYTCRILDVSGKIKWVNIRVGELPDSRLKTVTVLDNTREVKNLELLQNKERKYRVMIEHSHELILNVDRDGIIQFAGASALKILGYEPPDLMQSSLFSFLHPDDKSRIESVFTSWAEGPLVQDLSEFRFRHKNGTWVSIDAICNNLLENEHIRGFVITGRDISVQKVAEEKALYFEHHDALTGLPNRSMFIDRLELEIRQARRRKRLFSVMCLGMDRFKEVNDVYGAKTGDRILKAIGMRLSDTFRGDDYVARLSGDKFIILLSDIHNPDSANSIMSKTLKIFQKELHIESEKIRVTASMGVVFYPNDGITDEQLISNAETAMYMAKSNGRNTYQFYDSALHGKMMSSLKLERDLADALQKGELIDYYQPKVDVKGKIIGAECLIRWQSRDRGIVLPKDFISIAERNGAIVDIGYFMLHQACRRAKQWQQQGLAPIQISVNLSPYQFKQQDLVPRIKGILEDVSLDAQWLELEITETGIMADEEDSILKLKKLYDLGVSVSIDDFGTGYSSLNKLKDFPLTTLKIDKSFLHNISGGSKSSTITTAIIGLAHDLDFKVVAEGVETHDQLTFLKDNNCDFFQGFLFDKPLPAVDLEQRLTRIAI